MIHKHTFPFLFVACCAFVPLLRAGPHEPAGAGALVGAAADGRCGGAALAAPAAARAMVPGAPEGDARTTKITKIYIVQLTHLDIGFTAPPDAVAAECKARIDQVLGYLDAYATFKWTIESLWQLEQWLRLTEDPAQVKRLFDHTRAGRIAVGGGYANMHSSMLDSEELNRFFYPAALLRRQQGITIDTVLMNDVPGWSWALPQAMARSGCAYFLTGPNTWLGGAAAIPMADRPFYWEGPDGSRVLTWMSYNSYLEGAFDYCLHGSHSQMEQGVSAKLHEWEEAGYPYDAILILDGTGDNGMADNVVKVIGNVDWWNANHTIEMILATPGEFFRHMEATYPGRFPVCSGDSAGFWAGSGNCGAPVSQAAVRAAGDLVAAGERLAAVNDLLRAGGGGYPSEQIDAVYRDISRADEHSGAGTGWPGLQTKAEIDHNNELKYEESLRAYSGGEALLAGEVDGLAGVLGAGLSSPSVIVFNPLSWQRDGMVEVAPAELTGSNAFILRDAETQQEIAYQIGGEAGSVSFMAQKIPSVGYRVYAVEASPSPPQYPPKVVAGSRGRSLESDDYRISVGFAGLSILDKHAGRELVNGRSDFPFGGLIRAKNEEDFLGICHVIPFATGKISAVGGSVSGTLAVDFRSGPLRRAEIVLYGEVKRIDLTLTLDKAHMDSVPYADHSVHYSFCFPFELDVDRGFAALIDNPNLLLRPDRDYLPGAYVGNFVAQHGIDLREGSGFGVTLAGKEAFFNEIGGAGHRNTQFAPAEATVIVKAVQKLDQGDTKDQGEVTIKSLDNGITESRFAFALTSVRVPSGAPAGTAGVQALRFGRSFGMPLEAIAVTPQPPIEGEKTIPPVTSFMSLSHDNVVLTTVKMASFGDPSDVVFRLQEISGAVSQGVKLVSAFAFSSATLSTLVEEALPGGTLPVDPITFDIGPFETITIRAGRAESP